MRADDQKNGPLDKRMSASVGACIHHQCVYVSLHEKTISSNRKAKTDKRAYCLFS